MTELLYARDIYGKTLVELGRQDERIVVLDADLSNSTRTALFAREFPERFFNFGVAEQNMVAAAAGLASSGKIAFVSTFAMFATARTLDQLRNTVCYNNLNVKLVATHSGITVGEDGSSHQALEDIAFLRSIPRMTIIVPSDGHEAKDAIYAAYNTPGPFYIRLGRSKVSTISGKKPFSLGRGYIIEEGKDIAIIACGILVDEALKSRQMLQKEGISATVANIHTLKPIDTDLIISLARSHSCLLICEEHQSMGGLYSSVCETVCSHFPIRVKSIGINDRFGQSGSPKELLNAYGLTSTHIAKAAGQLLKT